MGLPNREGKSGLDGLSFAGGANIQIKGSQFSHYPVDNILMFDMDLGSFFNDKIPAPTLSSIDFILIS